MLSRLFWLVACPIVRDNHVRDWHIWDSMGLARCEDCRRAMTPPDLPPRSRL